MPIRTLDANAPDAVFAFLEDRVSARGWDHWRWKYRLDATAPPSAFYWEESDGRVLGFIGLMRTVLHTGSERHPAAWFVDWHVAAGEGGIGVGLGLLRKAEAEAGILLTLQGSADTREILPRLGWKQSRSPTTWMLPLTSRYLADWAGRQAPGWLRGAAELAGTAAGAWLRGRQPETPPDAALVEVDRFPRDHDGIWETRAPEFAPAMARDSGYLNYLCADYPGGGYHLALVRLRGETVGHLVWRVDADGRGFQRGRIVDVLWPRSRPDIGAWVMQSVCWQLEQAGADYVECLVSVPALDEVARQSRLRPRRPVPLWYHRVPAGVPDPDRWYITLLDCDRAYR